MGVLFFHWFIFTDEGVDRTTFVDRCRRVEGFPTDVLDLLEPSAKLLYNPLRDSLPGPSEEISVCSMLAPADELPFLDGQLRRVADAVGAEVDEDMLAGVLGGGDGALPEDIVNDMAGSGSGPDR